VPGTSAWFGIRTCDRGPLDPWQSPRGCLGNIPQLDHHTFLTALHADVGLNEHGHEDVRCAEVCWDGLESAQPASGVDDGLRFVVASQLRARSSLARDHAAGR
jgi:hypothetical protein